MNTSSSQHHWRHLFPFDFLCSHYTISEFRLFKSPNTAIAIFSPLFSDRFLKNVLILYVFMFICVCVFLCMYPNMCHLFIICLCIHVSSIIYPSIPFVYHLFTFAYLVYINTEVIWLKNQCITLRLAFCLPVIISQLTKNFNFYNVTKNSGMGNDSI